MVKTDIKASYNFLHREERGKEILIFHLARNMLKKHAKILSFNLDKYTVSKKIL